MITQLIGRKVGMTRFFNSSGQCVPVTVLELGPATVHQVKTIANDGYSALQLGIGRNKQQRISRPLKGHLTKAQKGIPSVVKEVQLSSEDEINFKVGDSLEIGTVFEVGAKVDVAATSSGKGFAGVMKRHGMKGFCATHGTHEYFRHGGSIGNRKFPGRVFKNKRMPGRMGGTRVTQQGLLVVDVRPSDNLLLVKGSVPGHKGATVVVSQSKR